jgi:hypothetical protein
MQIECATTIAAADVLFVLVDAHLRPGQEFHMAGPCLPDPPIRFTLRVKLPPAVVRQLQAIPDILIASAARSGSHAAPCSILNPVFISVGDTVCEEKGGVDRCRNTLYKSMSASCVTAND